MTVSPLTGTDLVHQRASLAGSEDGDVVLLTPEDAGWTYTGLRVIVLAPGETRVVETGASETFVLPLAGSLSVTVAPASDLGAVEAAYDLAGRVSGFTRVTDLAYAGRDSLLTLASVDGAEVALPSARCKSRLPSAYGQADAVPVETRGAGTATRQVNGFGVPGVWDHAEKLVACELLTPPGNWLSWPAHKHDATEPCEVVNEDGDVVLVPHGYHGPCVAAPGYPMYYLNVLAGPADDRSMAFSDDPAHGWLRRSRDGVKTDPRVPMTSAAEL